MESIHYPIRKVAPKEKEIEDGGVKAESGEMNGRKHPMGRYPMDSRAIMLREQSSDIRNLSVEPPSDDRIWIGDYLCNWSMHEDMLDAQAMIRGGMKGNSKGGEVIH